MKRLIAIILICLMLTGCTGAGEVQRRIVVHAVGIDPGEEGYEVSYQVFSKGSTDGGPVDADESNVATLLAQGQTLYETEESLRLQTGKEVFLGDAELIVINSELSGKDLSEFLSYFRKADVYLGVNIVYCRGKASETLGAKLEQGSATAILLRGVVESAVESGRACTSRIIEIYNAVETDGETVAVPIISLEKKEKKDGTTVSDAEVGVFGSVLISPDGPKGEIDPETAMGIRLLRGDAKKMSLTFEAEGGGASVELTKISSKRRIRLENGLPTVDLNISAKYDIRSSPEGSDSEKIRLAAEKKLLELCEKARNAAAKTGCDLMHVGKLLYKYLPDFAVSSGENLPKTAAGALWSVTAELQKY